MPNESFLQEYPLYRKFRLTPFPSTVAEIRKVRIVTRCPRCRADRTFTMTNNYNIGVPGGFDVVGRQFRLDYECVHCQDHEKSFIIRFDEFRNVMKIGQYPAWDITPDDRLNTLLGDHQDFYKKGLVCESQSYGIGAFAYYRRIVEEIIDTLLDDISTLLDGEEKVQYLAAVEQARKTTVTQEKIELVKDLLPPILRPDEMNPLATLHSTLSEGLHAETDETCMEYAVSIREVLIFLVNQIETSKTASNQFTSSMRKLLDKRARKDK